MPKLRVKESSDLDTLDYGRLGFTLNKVDWLELPLSRLVSMVGNDLMLDPGIGTCGKAGQGVPVGVAQPSILIDKMTVGGTKL